VKKGSTRTPVMQVRQAFKAGAVVMEDVVGRQV